MKNRKIMARVKRSNCSCMLFSKNKLRRIHKVKSVVAVKENYSDEDLELMWDNCDKLRDRYACFNRNVLYLVKSVIESLGSGTTSKLPVVFYTTDTLNYHFYL